MTELDKIWNELGNRVIGKCSDIKDLDNRVITVTQLEDLSLRPEVVSIENSGASLSVKLVDGTAIDVFIRQGD